MVMSKYDNMMVIEGGGGGVCQNMTVDDNMGGRGVRQPSKMYDVIYGWSLKSLDTFDHSFFFSFTGYYYYFT